jgi:hypothetical protein
LHPALVGSTVTGERALTTAHVYSDVLSHTIKVTVTDDGGASAATSVSVSPARVTTTAQPAVTHFSSLEKTVTLSAALVDQTHPAAPVRRTPTAAALLPLLPLARRGRFDLVRASVFGSIAYFKERAHGSIARFLNVLAVDVLGKKLDPRTKATLAAQHRQGATRTNLARTLLASKPSWPRIAQQLARKHGAARHQARNTRELAVALALGASERDVVLLLVLQQLEARPV